MSGVSSFGVRLHGSLKVTVARSGKRPSTGFADRLWPVRARFSSIRLWGLFLRLSGGGRVKGDHSRIPETTARRWRVCDFLRAAGHI